MEFSSEYDQNSCIYLILETAQNSQENENQDNDSNN